MQLLAFYLTPNLPGNTGRTCADKSPQFSPWIIGFTERHTYMPPFETSHGSDYKKGTDIWLQRRRYIFPADRGEEPRSYSQTESFVEKPIWKCVLVRSHNHRTPNNYSMCSFKEKRQKKHSSDDNKTVTMVTCSCYLRYLSFSPEQSAAVAHLARGFWDLRLFWSRFQRYLLFHYNCVTSMCHTRWNIK